MGMAKILVTGGAGFIGSHVVDRLIESGEQVIVVDNLSTGKLDNINDKAIFYEEDIVDEKMIRIFEKERPDYVIHYAAQIDVFSSIKNPLDDAKVNILGTINLLECCRKYGVKKIIYASSAAVYGEPEYLGIDEEHIIKPASCYAVSKYMPEHYLGIYKKLYNLNYVIFRYANVYGPRQKFSGDGGIIPIFVNKILSGEPPIIYGNGEQTRDFIFVKDVVDVNIKALENGMNQILNIGTGKRTSINKLLFLLSELMNYNTKPIYEERRIGDIQDSYFNSELAKIVLGWEARYSLEEGLKETISFYKKWLQEGVKMTEICNF